MSFDFRKSDTVFADDDTVAEYKPSAELRPTSHAFKQIPKHPRIEARRMVVIKPRVKSKKWTREAELASIAAPFKRLLEEVELKYGHQSSLQRLLFSEEYMAVIGLGPRVVPLLLADLKTGSTPWFWALKAVTRENIGEGVAGGDFRGLRQAWLAWGVSKGLL